MEKEGGKQRLCTHCTYNHEFKYVQHVNSFSHGSWSKCHKISEVLESKIRYKSIRKSCTIVSSPLMHLFMHMKLSKLFFFFKTVEIQTAVSTLLFFFWDMLSLHRTISLDMQTSASDSQTSCFCRLQTGAPSGLPISDHSYGSTRLPGRPHAVQWMMALSQTLKRSHRRCQQTPFTAGHLTYLSLPVCTDIFMAVFLILGWLWITFPLWQPWCVFVAILVLFYIVQHVLYQSSVYLPGEAAVACSRTSSLMPLTVSFMIKPPDDMSYYSKHSYINLKESPEEKS